MERGPSFAPALSSSVAQSFAVDGRLDGVVSGQLQFAACGPDVGGRRREEAVNAVEEAAEKARQHSFGVTVVVLRRVVADRRRRRRGRHPPTGSRLARDDRHPGSSARRRHGRGRGLCPRSRRRHRRRRRRADDRRRQHPRVFGDLLDCVATLDVRLQDAVDQVFDLVADALGPREADLALCLVLDHPLDVGVVIRHRSTDLDHIALLAGGE